LILFVEQVAVVVVVHVVAVKVVVDEDVVTKKIPHSIH
jgi:hypothetical protein